MGFVGHLPAGPLQPPGEVDVLGEAFGVPVTHLVEGAAAEGGHHAGYAEQTPELGLGPFDQADDHAEFDHLKPADHRGAVADAGVAGHGGQPGTLLKMAHHPGHRLGIEQGIAIDANQPFVAGQQGAGP